MTPPDPNPDGLNFIDALLEGMPPAAAAVALAGLVNRASARLHTLARGQASAYKGQAEWPAWAQLQNAARALVLQASTCRDLTARLPTDATAEPNAPPTAESQRPPADEVGAAADQPRQPDGDATAVGESRKLPDGEPTDASRPVDEPAASEPPREPTGKPEDLPPA